VSDPPRQPPFFDPGSADRRLARAAALWPDGAAQEALLRTLNAASDPDRALAAALEVAEALARRRPTGRATWQEPRWLEVVTTLAGASRAFHAALRRRPRLADRLRAERFLDRAKPRHHLDADLQRALHPLDPAAEDALPRLQRALRRIRLREMARIAFRDVSGRADVKTVAAEIADLAAACLDAAAAFLHAGLVARHGMPPLGEAGRADASAPGFAVLGMGKLGGRELNFSSDIDVIYVYAADGETEGGPGGTLAAFAFHARLAERLAKALGEVTEDGFVFRVDADLRPEGRSGPLVNSVRAFELYYETFGRTWERQALLKAVPVAGDEATGQAALDAVAPFVYRRSLDLEAVRSVAALKDEAARRAESKTSEYDVKLGRGGIRAVEFVVQSLQLLYAGKDPRLREAGTLPALDHLLFAGLLDEEDVRALADGYLFLRRLEHRIQIVDDRQTHRLPPAGRERVALARAMGYCDSGAEARFLEALESHRQAVERVFASRFGGPVEAPEVPEAFRIAADPEAEDEAREAALDEAGFGDPPAALAQLRRMGRRAASPFGRSRTEIGASLAPLLLIDASRSPDPDQALAHLAAFLTALPRAAAPGYHGLLHDGPHIRRLLLSLFGTSDFLSRDFVGQPELLDLLVMRGHAPAARDADAFRREVAERLARQPEGDPEARLVALRRYRREEVLRIGLGDVGGHLDVGEVVRRLSDLAEVLLEATLDLATEWAVGRWGRPRDPDGRSVALCVVALGKLGGRELGYGSDLDLLFLYGGAGETEGGSREAIEAQEFFARLAQRLVSYLTLPLPDPLYPTDTRLRPSGRQGALVSSLSAFRRYQERQAAVWERQALTRARPVAGDAAFREDVAALIGNVLYGEGALPTGRIREEVVAMRDRLEKERAGEGGRRFNPKTGRGGLVDIEFLVQFLQLVHGPTTPAIRTGGTADALGALSAAGHLDAHEAEAVLEGWWFLRRLEHRLRIVHDRPIEHLPQGGRSLEILARRMGYHRDAAAGTPGPGDALLADYRRITEAVRRVYDRILVTQETP
jgi:[glutamine synthetase] adenylyltransferase / [glutamine synthetase]-adenylyl-L-tyrosine phosphorylase